MKKEYLVENIEKQKNEENIEKRRNEENVFNKIIFYITKYFIKY
jgi:hypothetical protein